MKHSTLLILPNFTSSQPYLTETQEQQTKMETAIENFHINLEETRNKITHHAQTNFQSETSVQECHHLLSTVYHDVQRLFDAMPLPLVGQVGRSVNGEATTTTSSTHTQSNEVWYAMIENCKLKASQLAMELCKYVTSTSPASSIHNMSNNGDHVALLRTSLIDQNNGIESQTAIAQIVELTIRLIVEYHTPILEDQDSNDSNDSKVMVTQQQRNNDIQEMIKRYTSYQRSLLRHRSKPSIENIAQIRKYAKQSQLCVSDYIYQTTPQHYDDNDDDDDNNDVTKNNENDPQKVLDREEYQRYCKQPYAHAVTVILGEASSLLHPLMMWTDGIHGTLAQLELNNNKSHSSQQHRQQHRQRRHPNYKEEVVQSSLMEMCANTIDTIHLEAEHLSISIGNWFLKDNQESFANSTTTHLQQQQQHQQQQQNQPQQRYHHNGSLNNQTQNENESALDLTILDNSLDEMAYLCQVIHRYCTFSKHIAEHIQRKQLEEQKHNDQDESHHSVSNNNNKITLAQHLQEQSLFYSTAETKLTNANLQQAFRIAKPVEMILGMEIYAPSIVDDAYFISTRALERASGTLEHKAVWTIAHWIVDIWSADEVYNNGDGLSGGNDHSHSSSTSSVYHALLNNLGCTVYDNDQDGGNKESNDRKSDNARKETKKGFSFSSVLIDALDSTTASGNNSSKDNNDSKGAPRSGGPLSGSSLLNRNTVDVHKVEMDTQFCTLNGIHAASSACLGLAESFETMIAIDEEGREAMDEKTTSMIKLAKSQMESHSKSYKRLLEGQSHYIVVEWCGSVQDTSVAPPLVASLRQSPCMHRIFFYISNEEYNLNSSDFHKAEADERLEKLLLSPLRDSRLLSQVGNGKCDEGVTIAIVKDISCQVISLVLDTILNQRKSFSDWGSLLLSKQVRMLEQFFCSIVLKEDNESAIIDTAVGANTSQILNQFHRIKQAITILQLDKPSDWAAFAYEVGKSTDLDLSQKEIRSVMTLREDWSLDKIDAVCGPQSS